MDTFFLGALIVLVIGLGVFVVASVRLERAHRLQTDPKNQRGSNDAKSVYRRT